MRKKVMILAVVLVLCVALFLYKDTIMSLAGFGAPSDDLADLDSIPSLNVETPPQVAAPAAVATNDTCNADNANICLDSAKKFISEKDLVKALGLLIQGCEYNNAESCLALANIYNDDNAIPKSQYIYFGYISKACLLNNMEACHDLGVQYYRGDELTKRDIKKSFDLFKKVCDSGDMKGCNNLAVIYNNGGGSIKKNTKLAREMFDKACKNGYQPSCDNITKVSK